MIDLAKIKDIITVMPLLIIYILPGYVFIAVKDFILNKKQDDDKNIIIKSIVISYIIINVESIITQWICGTSIDITSSKIIIVTFLFAVLISYAYSRIVNSDKFSCLLKLLKITRSLKTDLSTEIVDFQLGMWVRVFVNSEQVIYVGKLRKFEQVSECIYQVALSNFKLYNYSGIELEDKEDFNTEWVFINLKDNYRIELIYEPNSRKIIN